MTLALYLMVTLAALIGLTLMILAIARSLAAYLEHGPRAKAAGAAIATGFVAMGGGVVLLIGTLIAFRAETGQAEMGVPIFATGLAVLILGIGFSQAMTVLRASLAPAGPANADNWPKARTVPLEPVLP